MTPTDSGDWAEYAAAARRLGRLRQPPPAARPAAGPAGDPAHVRDRLAAQRHQLLALGVPAAALDPPQSEVAARRAAIQAGGAPARQSAIDRAAAEISAATATLAGQSIGQSAGPWAAGGFPVWMRNLLVYGPFAVIVLLVQVALFVAAGVSAPLGYVLSCGLIMPLVAFGIGWLAVGFVFAVPGQRVDRTPLVGIVACAAPLLLAGVLAVAALVTRG